MISLFLREKNLYLKFQFMISIILKLLEIILILCLLLLLFVLVLILWMVCRSLLPLGPFGLLANIHIVLIKLHEFMEAVWADVVFLLVGLVCAEHLLWFLIFAFGLLFKLLILCMILMVVKLLYHKLICSKVSIMKYLVTFWNC